MANCSDCDGEVLQLITLTDTCGNTFYYYAPEDANSTAIIAKWKSDDPECEKDTTNVTKFCTTTDGNPNPDPSDRDRWIAGGTPTVVACT